MAFCSFISSGLCFEGNVIRLTKYQPATPWIDWNWKYVVSYITDYGIYHTNTCFDEQGIFLFVLQRWIWLKIWFPLKAICLYISSIRVSLTLLRWETETNVMKKAKSCDVVVVGNCYAVWPDGKIVFNIWPFTTMEFCPKAYKKISNKPFKCCQRFLNFC